MIRNIKMPHFYRYRVEDKYEPLSRGTTPALMSPAVTRRSEAPTPTPSVSARVSLLGSDVDISVPTNEDRRKLTQMFTLLESTIRELKDENKHLR